MDILQFTPFDPYSSIYQSTASETVKETGGNDTFISIIILVICFVTLSEPFKLILRRNIGKRALGFIPIFFSSAIYLAYAFLLVLGIGIFDYNDSENIPLLLKYLVSKIAFTVGALFYIVLAFYVLHRGMKEHYRAKETVANVNNWQQLEYRSHSITMADKLKKGWKQKLVWRIAEPRKYFWICFCITIIHIPIGLPLLVSAAFFWLNEWYQVHYKHVRAKESYLDMKIEMQKAHQYFNQSVESAEVFKVKTE